MTERQAARFPAHVFVMLSASTAAYALALAAVTGLQSADDAALAAARDPVANAVEQLAAGHDQLGARLDRGRAVYAGAAQDYVAAGGSLATLEAQLGVLSKTVDAIDGVSRSLPSTLRLPSVARSVAGTRPASHGTTGASGG